MVQTQLDREQCARVWSRVIVELKATGEDYLARELTFIHTQGFSELLARLMDRYALEVRMEDALAANANHAERNRQRMYRAAGIPENE